MELETFKQTNNSLVNLIQEGFLLLEKRDFSSLDLIAKEIIESYPKCFWGYSHGRDTRRMNWRNRAGPVRSNTW